MQPAIIVRAFIASPGDVAKERQAAREAILSWNGANSYDRETIIEPVTWESHAQLEQGAHPQEIINRQLTAQGYEVADSVAG